MDHSFEIAYISLRDKEHRIYSDDEVQQLPLVKKDHIYREEWKLRAASAARLINYLSRKQKPLHIHEVGCGNGWLSHQLSRIDNTRVLGSDINNTELEQAKRVFAGINNLWFEAAAIHSIKEQFDMIVFAASIQYFSSLTETISTALNLLKPGGEIHVIDSPFYNTVEVAAAKQRSKTYFEKMGHEDMSPYYHHHSLEELKNFRTRIKYNPNALLSKLRHRSPFYWIMIPADQH